MKTERARPTDVNEYLAAFPRPVRGVLERVRRAIRRAIPGAQEAISYGIPAFKINGHTAIYFAGWKAHYSIYPANARMVGAFRKALEPYEVNNKGTIRFPLSEPVPVALIEGLAKFRAREVAGDVPPKAAAAKTPRTRAARATRSRA
jgi:uncharacterized protein YdhG (YjbR/CyaY superfamily)